MDLLCHACITTGNLSYRFPFFETSATALCGSSWYVGVCVCACVCVCVCVCVCLRVILWVVSGYYLSRHHPLREFSLVPLNFDGKAMINSSLIPMTAGRFVGPGAVVPAHGSRCAVPCRPCPTSQCASLLAPLHHGHPRVSQEVLNNG